MDGGGKSCVVILIIVAIAVGVWYFFFRTDDGAVGEDGSEPIGEVTRKREYVGHQSWETAMHEVTDTEKLYNKDSVKVTNEGEAILTFGNIKIILFNDSDLKEIHSKASSETPADLHCALERGGFLSKVTETGSRATYKTPVDDKTITVTGTWMFMVYDPSTELTVVGNFEGKVHVDAGGEQLNLGSGKYVIIPAHQPPSDQFEIPFTLDEYQDFGDGGTSAIDILLEYGMFALEEEPPNDQHNLGTTENPLYWVFTPVVDQDSAYAGFEELAALIYEYSGLFVEPYFVPNSDAVIELMCAGEGQITSLQAIPYLLASKHSCAQTSLVSTRFGSIAYNSQIFVNDESGIQSLSELKGEFFCRPDPTSPTGWIIPNLSLKAAGIDAETDFYSIYDTGSHNEVVSTVYGYDCVAGATYVDAREAMQQDLPDVMDVVRVISVSPDIPNDGVQLHPGLDEDLRSLLVDTLLEIADTDAGKELFGFIFAWDDLSPSDDTYYDGFRDLLDSADVSVEELN